VLLFLIILDFVWSVSAFWYDADKLLTLSPFLWLFVAVCPVFPFLLALVLLQLYRKKSPNQFLPPHQRSKGVISWIKSRIFYDLPPSSSANLGFWWGGVLAFAAIPSAVYGVLAILYYPIAMYYQGFSWNAFGQIFWVLFYALQGLWLLRKFKIGRFPFVFVSILLILQLVIIDFYYKSFGYFDFTGISSNLLIGLLFLAVISLGVFYKIRKN